MPDEESLGGNCQICGNRWKTLKFAEIAHNSWILRIPRCLRRIYSLNHVYF